MKIARNISFFLLISILLGCSQSVLTSTVKQQVANSDTICLYPDVLPTFKGGDRALYKFIADNLVYPPEAAANIIEGLAVVQCIVDKKGYITYSHIVKSSKNKDLDAEAVRLVRIMPRWNAGKKNGQFVKVYYFIPIRFKVTEEHMIHNP